MDTEVATIASSATDVLALAACPRTSRVAVGPWTVLVVDGWYRDPAAVRALALRQRFHRGEGRFPGYVATVAASTSGGEREVQRITGLAIRVDADFRHRVVFNAMSRRVAAELRAQGPHVDLGRDLAGVLYLMPDDRCRGGTAFWRHRGTGLLVPPTRIDAQARSFMRRRGLRSREQLFTAMLDDHPPAEGRGFRFVTETSAQWELVASVPMRCNRLVLYPSALFHSALVTDEMFGELRSTRRLTQVMFFTSSAR